ncbi:MAG TPA: bifunctional metallophosphatase/5'-nucleotidase, partial [Candidatus Melainabacteria bacterium]|nr:bifunctional metallophosphatase/5'-nucleotidase [Candidatus Melainabacteria bacterium]
MQKEKAPNKSLNVRRFLKLAVIALSLLGIAHVSAVTSNTWAADEDFHFTILHTNDLHSHAESFSERGKLVGGMARLGHLIHSIKNATPNTIVIDAGDMFQGTPLFTHYHGEVEVSLL